MSTQDPTIPKRSKDLRLRHKRSGDESYLLWLSSATQARLARLKREGETLAQLVDRALEALEKNRQGEKTAQDDASHRAPPELPGVANSVAKQQPQDRQRLEVWVPEDLVDSLRAFLLGGVAQQRESVANSVAKQHESVADQREGVANHVAKQRLVAQAEELRGQGVSLRDIARRWNAENIPTLTGRGQWHGASVARLVNSNYSVS
jgi:hypothetical protein